MSTLPAPTNWIGSISLPPPDGRVIRIRHVRPDDDLLIAEGIKRFVGDILLSNAAMLGLARKLAPHASRRCSQGVCHVEFDLL